jgi:hypothetical protein
LKSIDYYIEILPGGGDLDDIAHLYSSKYAGEPQNLDMFTVAYFRKIGSSPQEWRAGRWQDDYDFFGKWVYLGGSGDYFWVTERWASANFPPECFD